MERVANWNIWMVFDYFTNLFSRNSIRAVVMLMVMLLIAACLFILSDIEHGENRKKQLGIVYIVGVFVLISFAVKSVMGASAASTAKIETNTESSFDEEESEESMVKEEESEDVQERETLILALNEGYIPYAYYDENGNLTGVDVEIAEVIAESLNMELVIEEMPFDSILSYVRSSSLEGENCIGMSGLVVTDERLEMVDFSETYVTDTVVAVVRGDSGVTRTDMVTENMKLGTQEETTADWYFNQVENFANNSELVQALVEGEVDVALMDKESIALAEEYGMIVLDDPVMQVHYAIAVGKENEELKSNINEALGALNASGDIDRIFAKYNKEILE